MGAWKLWFALLLSLSSSIDGKATFVNLLKTIGNEPDVTPLCIDDTVNIILLIVCKIRTERHEGKQCRLYYQHGHGFVHKCDSRFTLVMKNRTVFLHLNGLTAADSGNYTCECSHLDETYVHRLEITVEEDGGNDSQTQITQMPFSSVLIGVTAAIVTAGLILWFIYKTKSNGGCLTSVASTLPEHETPGSLHEDELDGPYTSLQQPASDLYQSISNPARNTVTVHLDSQEKGGGESDPSCTDYENI